jgi:hypothetical protein
MKNWLQVVKLIGKQKQNKHQCSYCWYNTIPIRVNGHMRHYCLNCKVWIGDNHELI